MNVPRSREPGHSQHPIQVEAIGRNLRETGLDLISILTLETVESVIMADMPHTIATLAKL
jgi:transcriptional regulator of NAD metabolism